jgi:hypothetical protein
MTLPRARLVERLLGLDAAKQARACHLGSITGNTLGTCKTFTLYTRLACWTAIGSIVLLASRSPWVVLAGVTNCYCHGLIPVAMFCF